MKNFKYMTFILSLFLLLGTNVAVALDFGPDLITIKNSTSSATPGNAAIPEVTSMILIGAGLFIVASLGRRCSSPKVKQSVRADLNIPEPI